MRKQGDTYLLDGGPVYLLSHGCCVGRKEGEGPLAGRFDQAGQDNWFGESTWEKSECRMVQLACRTAMKKAGLHPHQIGCALGGDLLNQCVSTSFAMRTLGVPFLGLYGACSTMAQSLMMAGLTVDGGYSDQVVALTSSHFASSERQYRFPLGYGGQRTPTAQWTVTGAGAALVCSQGDGPHIDSATCGTVTELGIKDAGNMGAAMAPAALATIKAHLEDLGRSCSDFDLIVTGDLGLHGKQLLLELARRDGLDLGEKLTDCGTLVFDMNSQDVHSGGSGCGCSAITLCGYLLDQLHCGKRKRILFCGTGALLSPTSTQQCLPLAGICHAVSITGGV